MIGSTIMKRNVVVIKKLFWVFLYITLTQSALYYVDQAHPQASDSNPGTESQPWLTIQYAADTAHAGDTVIVKEGTYKERIHFGAGHTGMKDSPIVFKGEPRRSVTMWGFYTRNCSYLRIEGFSVIGDTSLTDWTDGGGVFVYSDFVEVVDNYFFEIGIGIRSYWHEPYPKGGYVADNRMYRCQFGITINGVDWVIERNEVERLVFSGSGDADYSRLFGENIIFRKNHFHGSRVDEIGAAHVDCWQTFTNNGEYLRNVIIEANICEQCHQGLMASNVDTTDCHDIIFRNNIFHDCWAWGLCIYDISNFTVENNSFVNIKYHAAGFNGNSKGNIVRNNIFYNANSGYWAKDGGEVTGDYNLLFNTTDGTPAPHNILDTDPLFVDTANDDFRLQSHSPAIDTGMALTGFTTDIIGTTRPQGDGWDIGAYEYNGNIGTIFSNHFLHDYRNGFQVKITASGVRFSFPLPDEGMGCQFISIYDLSGRRIIRLPVKISNSIYTAFWDGKNRVARCAPGYYIARLENIEKVVKQSFVLIP